MRDRTYRDTLKAARVRVGRVYRVLGNYMAGINDPKREEVTDAVARPLELAYEEVTGATIREQVIRSCINQLQLVVDQFPWGSGNQEEDAKQTVVLDSDAMGWIETTKCDLEALVK